MREAGTQDDKQKQTHRFDIDALLAIEPQSIVADRSILVAAYSASPIIMLRNQEAVLRHLSTALDRCDALSLLVGCASEAQRQRAHLSAPPPLRLGEGATLSGTSRSDSKSPDTGSHRSSSKSWAEFESPKAPIAMFKNLGLTGSLGCTSEDSDAETEGCHSSQSHSCEPELAI